MQSSAEAYTPCRLADFARGGGLSRRDDTRLATLPQMIGFRTSRRGHHGCRRCKPQRQRPAEGLICHSDRGSQYASEAYGKQLIAIKAKPSMSRTACCDDNAPMESFFHTVKVEFVHQRRWATREEARRDLFVYIESYYNRRRIHSTLGYRTPEQAERHMA